MPPQIPDHQLLKRIGRGSYGEVWLARNALGQYRAVKILSRLDFADARPWEREFRGLCNFERVSRLHPNQMLVFHVGKRDDEGFLYYVMELADDCERGQEIDPERYQPRTLESERQRRGRLPVSECVHLGLSLTSSLGHLHQHRLVHRDVKPSNIIFVNGIPKLGDIGLVAGANAEGSFVGTEGFTPPEGPGTIEADLFGLGKVLYEVGMGLDRREFPQLPRELRAWPEEQELLELNAIALKACEKEPRRRYRSADEMRSDLLLLEAGKSIKRLHWLEKSLGRAIKVGIVIGLVAVVTAFGLQEARQAERNARQRLERVQVAHALNLMDNGDYSGAMLWVADSLQLVKGDAAAEEMHRYRFEALWRNSPRLLTVLVHGSRLTRGEFSPDGRRVLTACADGTARLWNAASGEVLRTFPKQEAEIKFACFSRDGGRILTADAAGTACLWRTDIGELVCPPIHHNVEITSAALSPDSAWVVTAGELPRVDDESQRRCEARLWDANTGELTGRAIAGPAGAVPWVNFSPDGREVLIAMANEAQVLRVPFGSPMIPPLRHAETVRQGVFSFDGRLIVTASEDGTARVWEAKTAQPVGPPLRHHGGVLCAAFSRDGKYVATGSRDRTARVWEIGTGQPVTDPLRHGHDVRLVEFSPDGRWIVTRSLDQTIRVWDARTGEAAWPPLDHYSNVASVTFSPEGRRVLTCTWDGGARVWDLVNRIQVMPPLKVGGRPNTVQFDPTGRELLVGNWTRPATIWDVISGRLKSVLGKEEPPCPFVKFSPGGRWVATLGDVVSIWEAATGSRVLKLDGGGYDGSGTFSPNADRFALCNRHGEVKIWQLRTPEPPVLLPVVLSHGCRVAAAAFSPDGGRMITGTGDFDGRVPGETRVWDLTTGRLAFPPIRQQGRIQCVAFSPDGQRFLTAACDETLNPRDARVWDAQTGRAVTPPLHHQDGVTHAEFSPDGTRVVTASEDSTARVWDARTGAPITPLLRHENQVSYATFSPDGRRVLTTSFDNTARVWDAGTGELLAPPLRHRGPVRQAVFSPDGRRVATASDDGTVQIWELPKTNLPVEDLRLWAELVSGRRIDATAGFEALSPARLRQIRDQLSARYPAQFKD